MNLFQLFKNIVPYVRPYKWLVLLALVLTFIGALTAQINAYVLQYTVNSIASLVEEHKALRDGLHIIVVISVVLLSKEIVNIFISFGQKFFGEKIRILISQDLAQRIIEKVLTFRMAFFTADESGSGKLQTRIDQGVSSLTRTVQSFFIDIFPSLLRPLWHLSACSAPISMSGLWVSALCRFIFLSAGNKRKS